MNWMHYRQNSLGEAIHEVLEDYAQNEEELSDISFMKKVIDLFDREMNEFFKHSRANLTFKCEKLVAYRETLGVWTFWVKNATFKERTNNLIKCDSIQIVAVGDAQANCKKARVALRGQKRFRNKDQEKHNE